jgi:ATP-binding cassette subfamily B protein
MNIMLNTNSPKKLWNFFWYFYKQYKISIIFFIIFTSLLGLHGLVNSYCTKIIIDKLVTLQNKTFLMSQILWPSIFIIFGYIVYNTCWRLVNYINYKVAPIIKNNVISYVFNYIHSQSQRFFQDNLTGSISNNIVTLSDNIERISSILSGRIIRGVTQLLAAIISMYFINPIFSAVLLVWVICFSYISMIYSKKIVRFSNDYAQSQAYVSGKIVDSIANFLNVKVFARANFEFLYLQQSLNFMKEKFQNKEWFLIKFYFLQGVSITCFIGAVIYFLIKLNINNHISIGDFAFILSLSFYIIESVWSITEHVDQMNDAIGKCNQCLKKLFTPIEIKNNNQYKSLVVKHGKIIFDKVQFYYKDTEPLFQNKNVIIQPGEKIGLVGYSGSGKTTFINLLLRLYDVISGRILIDGHDVCEVTQDSLHSAIGIIPQDPSLFHRSIMENIRYGLLDATDHEVIEAAKYANIDEFIVKLSQGYKTLVGERGIKLSCGQRQRIAIARIILKKPQILILDEATSQLDSITENTITNALSKLMQGKTTLVIAHRLSTLLNMDRIFVFEQGKIIENGKHTDLLEKKGLYKALWDAQIRGYLPY